MLKSTSKLGTSDGDMTRGSRTWSLTQRDSFGALFRLSAGPGNFRPENDYQLAREISEAPRFWAVEKTEECFESYTTALVQSSCTFTACYWPLQVARKWGEHKTDAAL